MNKIRYRNVGALLLGGALLVTGCVVHDRAVYRDSSPVVTSSGEVVVTEAPPAPIQETVTVAPGPAYVWVSGGWVWGGGRWRWETGHWARPPRPGAVWRPHHYVYRGGRHYWARGGWH